MELIKLQEFKTKKPTLKFLAKIYNYFVIKMCKFGA